VGVWYIINPGRDKRSLITRFATVAGSLSGTCELAGRIGRDSNRVKEMIEAADWDFMVQV